MRIYKYRNKIGWLFAVCWIFTQSCVSAPDLPFVSFQEKDGRLEIKMGGDPFAVYVYKDAEIPRPYFCDVHAPGGFQVTRNHPPVSGSDPTDHAAYHPGIWLSFGDLSGADFWRNKARTRHARFINAPQGGIGRGSFSVENAYITADGERRICQERCEYSIVARAAYVLLIFHSDFSSSAGDFYFGDQEEMGLGVRTATPLTVKNGGTIMNSAGLKNESEVWGKQADWCDYSGIINERRTGVALMTSPENFRQSWFHARDYGLLTANPFGRNAFTKEKPSRIEIKQGETFSLCFGVYIYSVPEKESLDLSSAYQDFLNHIAQE